ncbi:uncharacterized protein LOC111331580 [Stylophora pistillata]|uniref:uncharacterized protein LOC111331580 n=1 Tax=Stylophora pistillata TaxID=50429 RepID=UPI000C04EED9|nr:uncharacterized protein LOC111331580 [Stylophora pistillata]
MASQFSLSEEGLAVKSGREHIFPSNCLKRKLEVSGLNEFSSVGDHDMSVEQEHNLNSEKRQRFSVDSNGHTVYLSNVKKDDKINCPSFAHNGNLMGIDSRLQSNIECNTSIGWEGVRMDCESERENPNQSASSCKDRTTSVCPPNLNINIAAEDISVEISSRESSPTKGSPAREFLRTYRPEHQMYCIPSYCHPGGLWDVMLEVYHGL